MKAMDIFKEAQKRYYYECFPREVVNAYSFQDNFNYRMRSLVRLEVAKQFISGTQGVSFSPRDMTQSNLLKLDRTVVDGGYWLWCYEGNTGKFDLINYRNRDTLKELISDIKKNNLRRVDVIVIKG